MEKVAQPETIPVNVQLEQILKTSDPEELVKLLGKLATHRNVNYQKANSHVLNVLKELALDFDQTLDVLCRMSPAFRLSNTRPYMSQNIYKGFENYWKGLDPPLEEKQKVEGLKLISKIHTTFIEDFVAVLWNEELVEEVWAILDSKDFERGLRMLRSFKLLGVVDKDRLTDVLVRAISTAAEFEFFFREAPEIHQMFARRLESNGNHKLCSDFVQRYKLTPTDFPAMMWELEKNSLNYYMREYPLHCAQLKFAEEPRHLCYLITRYFQKDQHLAEALMKKYNLYGNKVFELEGYERQAEFAQSRRRSARTAKNVLQERDAFGATQLRVLGEPEDYLQLEDLLLKEEDVLFIDSVDSEGFQTAQNELLKSRYVGLDCEFNGAVTKFDETSISLIQLATKKQVFIFDVPKLERNADFLKFLQELFVGTSDVTFLVFGGKEDLSMIRKIIGNVEGAKPIRFIDLQVQAAKDIEKDPMRLSLKKVSEDLFGKKFSKFEQCSGWATRPLRKAQLHYAALDARVLLDIYDSLTFGRQVESKK